MRLIVVLLHSTLAIGMWILPSAGVIAGEMVVIQATGTDLSAGQVIDGNSEIVLSEGATVTLIGQDGTPVQLAGPYSGAPGAGGGDGTSSDVVDALAQLLGGGTDANKAIGGTRSVRPAKLALPTPSAVPVGDHGDHCVDPDGTTFLWRVDVSQGLVVHLRAADGSWEGKQDWPAGQDRLPLPRNFPASASQAFVLTAGKDVSNVTLHRIPAGLTKPGLRAAWLAKTGCDLQARALLEDLQ